MLTAIEPCEPPVLTRDRNVGPTTDLDHLILQALAQRAGLRLQDITQVVGGTTHRVHARVQTLIERGLVHRERIPGGPRRGPGASRYLLTQATLGSTDTS